MLCTYKVQGIFSNRVASPYVRMYKRYALPYERRIYDAAHELGALLWLHLCGDTTHLLSLMPESGADISAIDWMADTGLAARTFDDGR